VTSMDGAVSLGELRDACGQLRDQFAALIG
jgi:hypothetical protein